MFSDCTGIRLVESKMCIIKFDNVRYFVLRFEFLFSFSHYFCHNAEYDIYILRLIITFNYKLRINIHITIKIYRVCSHIFVTVLALSEISI